MEYSRRLGQGRGMTDFPDLTPRSFWQLFLRMGGKFVIFAAFVVIICTALSIKYLRVADTFDQSAQPVLAEVINKEFVEEDEDGRREAQYHVTFRYFEPDHVTEISKRRSVTKDEFEAYEVGEKIDIVILPQWPEAVEILPGENRRNAQLMQRIALILGSVALLFLWVHGQRAAGAVLARKNGRVVLARIDKVRERSTLTDDNKRAQTYSLVWTDADGATAESLKTAVDLTRHFEPGDEITVFKRGRGRGWWVGDVGDRAEHPRPVPDVGKD